MGARHLNCDLTVNFDKIQASLVDFPDTYDYKSIMHYDGYAFGRIDQSRRVRLATMTPLKPGIRLDDNMKFTSTDIEKLNRLGQCANQNNQYSSQVATECKDVAANCEGNRRVRKFSNFSQTLFMKMFFIARNVQKPVLQKYDDQILPENLSIMCIHSDD